MMRKIISIFMAILIVFLLTACNSNNIETTSSINETTTESENLVSYEKYDEKIDEYRKALSMGKEAFEEKYYGDYSSLNYLMVSDAYDFGSIYYLICDIDDNGVSELLFKSKAIEYDSGVIDIYTLDGDNLVKLFEDCDFGYRSYLYICSDGSILSYGSDSAFSGLFDKWKISSSNKLEHIEGYFYLEEGYDDDEQMYLNEGYIRLSVDEYNEKLSFSDAPTKVQTAEWIEIEKDIVANNDSNESNNSISDIEPNVWYTVGTSKLIKVQNCDVSKVTPMSSGVMMVTYYPVCQSCHIISDRMLMDGVIENNPLLVTYQCDNCKAFTYSKIEIND